MVVSLVKNKINVPRVLLYFFSLFVLVSFAKFHHSSTFHTINSILIILLFILYSSLFIHKKIKLTLINRISIVYISYIYIYSWTAGTLDGFSEPFIIITLILFFCYAIRCHFNDFLISTLIFFIFFSIWQLYLEITYVYAFTDNVSETWLVPGKNFVVRIFLPGIMFVLINSWVNCYNIFSLKTVIPIGIITATIICATSTTGIFGVGVFFILLLLSNKKVYKYFTINFFLFLTIGIYLLILFFNIQERFESFLLLFGKNATLTHRTEVWQYALEKVYSNPLFGTGLGSLLEGDSDSILIIHHAHQYWLNSLMTTGIIGTLFLITIYFVANNNLKRQSNNNPIVKYIVITIATFLFMGIDESLTSAYMIIPILNMTGINLSGMMHYKIKKKR